MSKIDYKEVYPIDVNGIAQIGVENWLKHYDPPFDPIKYKKTHLEIYNKYISMVCNANNEKINKFLIANFKIVIIVLEELRKFEIKKKLKKEYKYFLSKNFKIIDDIPSGLSELNFAKFYADGRKRFKNEIRSRIKNIFLFIKYSSSLRTKDQIYYQGTFNFPIQKYLIANNKYPTFLNPSISSNLLTSHSLPNEIKSTIDSFLKGYEFLSENQTISLKKLIKKMLYNNWIIYENLIENLRPNGHLLLSNGLGSIMHRLVVVAWSLNGGKTIGFMHGNSDFTSYSPEYIGYDGILICDEMICYSDFQKEQLKEAINDFGGNLNCSKIIIQR